MTAPVEAIAARLLAARTAHARVSLADAAPADAAQAYAVQDAVARALGPIGGWKVGAKGPDREPACAPLAAAGILAAPAVLQDGGWRVRGIETELAVRFATGLPPRERAYGRDEVFAAIGAVMPAIEVVETRLTEFPSADPLHMLADGNAHGALVLGQAQPPARAWLDGTTLHATQWFDSREVAATHGGNPAGDLLRLLTWLADHCAQRGLPITAGQVVTTGSCTGMMFAPAGTAVRGSLEGLGECVLRFGAAPGQ